MPTAIDLCQLAWQGQKGYVCLSWRDPSKDKSDEGYWSDRLFRWPDDKPAIERMLSRGERSHRDLYWAPTVFRKAQRSASEAKDVSTLWGDLDEVDPAKLPAHLKPTATWRTSPGRWQALWRMDTSLSPDDQTHLNQRLTYAIGADKGGFDITQVLRVPGTINHKYKDSPRVELIYLNGHQVSPAKLVGDLPELSVKPKVTTETGDLPLYGDVLAVYSKKFNARTKELIKARHAVQGTRSDRLWELECLLAELHMTPAEIACVAQHTVWNKFKDRHDELLRLVTEASKAIEHVGAVDESEGLILEDEDIEPQDWATFDREHDNTSWLIADLWAKSEVGFISGAPKTYKSWLAVDLAVSVASGSRFLDSLQTRRGNVLLIQEEDPKVLLQERLGQVASNKGLIEAHFEGNVLHMKYDLPTGLYVISNQGFQLTDEWIDRLEAWIIQRDIELVILDPLMMIAGSGFDEFKAFEFMQKVLKPIKMLRARTHCAIAIVHHHLKNSADTGARAMYGSVALWAWEEAALHLTLANEANTVVAERFSKHALLKPLTVEIGDITQGWNPKVHEGKETTGIVDAISSSEGGATVEELVGIMGVSRDVVERQLSKLRKEKAVRRTGSRGTGKGRPASIWSLISERG